MAGLQRLITYIYKYENDEKKENVGFAKVEIRGSICRIEVHIRNINTEQRETTVYLFARKAEIMQGIPVGTMAIARGNGDVRFVFETKELLNFGKTMQEIEGMFIPIGDNAYLASDWKEGRIERGLFHIIEKQDVAEPQSSQTASAQQDVAASQFPRQEVPRADFDENEAVAPQSSGTYPDRQDEEDASITHAESPRQQTAEEQPSETKSKKIEAPTPQAPHNVHTTELPLENFREEAAWNHLFQKLRLKLDIFFPFEGQEIECVRMQLNDLQNLPKKYWYLGNNSFLLHGFFNYRHIILGQIVEDGRKEYFLGVPGVFQNQERIMAAMFGFPEFRTAKNAEYKTGNFGYWYRIL